MSDGHRLVHLAGEARCSCGWKPTSSRRQVASVHQHATRESQKAWRELQESLADHGAFCAARSGYPCDCATGVRL